MRIGVTGHQRLDDPSSWAWVNREMEKILTAIPKPLIGITSLAIGADQLFADAILNLDGSIKVIIPFEGYEQEFIDGQDRAEYLRLLKNASEVEILAEKDSKEESFFEAGKRVVELADLLLAVWNGKPAAGLGGTADVVKYASQRRKSIFHLNPLTHKTTGVSL